MPLKCGGGVPAPPRQDLLPLGGASPELAGTAQSVQARRDSVETSRGRRNDHEEDIAIHEDDSTMDDRGVGPTSERVRSVGGGAGVTRRGVLVGGVALALGPAQLRWPAPAGAQEAASPTADVCVLTPELTEEPYCLPLELVRRPRRSPARRPAPG